MDELLKAALSGFVSLIAVLGTFLLERGSTGRRRRRDLVDELDLAEKLGNRAEAQARTESRIERLLEEYEIVTTPVDPRWLREARWAAVACACVGVFVGLLAAVLADWTWWWAAILGAVVGLGFGVGSVFDHRDQQRKAYRAMKSSRGSNADA